MSKWLMKKIYLKYKLYGLKISREPYPKEWVIFLLIFFYRATQEEWVKIKNIIHSYKKGSGLVVNEQKYSILFSFNTLASINNLMLLSIGVGKVATTIDILSSQHL